MGCSDSATAWCFEPECNSAGCASLVDMRDPPGVPELACDGEMRHRVCGGEVLLVTQWKARCSVLRGQQRSDLIGPRTCRGVNFFNLHSCSCRSGNAVATD